VALTLPASVCLLPIVAESDRSSFTLPGGPSRPEYLAILGLLFLITGYSNFIFTLVLHAAAVSIKRRKWRGADQS
jgi:hypothetical protein